VRYFGFFDGMNTQYASLFLGRYLYISFYSAGEIGIVACCLHGQLLLRGQSSYRFPIVRSS
jgi:hypothetical protein